MTFSRTQSPGQGEKGRQRSDRRRGPGQPDHRDAASPADMSAASQLSSTQWIDTQPRGQSRKSTVQRYVLKHSAVVRMTTSETDRSRRAPPTSLPQLARIELCPLTHSRNSFQTLFECASRSRARSRADPRSSQPCRRRRRSSPSGASAAPSRASDAPRSANSGYIQRVVAVDGAPR